MGNIIASLIATFVTLPLLGWIVCYALSLKITKDKKKAFKISVDFTTFLLIIACHYLLYEISGKSFLWVIIITLILTGVLFSFLHWKTKEELKFFKIMKGVWRFNFLLFSISYLLLLMLGLTHRISVI
ncbi:DUF3397 domain-containing protein [Bacillus taeanensis]|uniref:DUF3397 domain-containing protein n=1 Tax=Bacillus taeanensis TaxID=273032 RepID=A0A366XV06_9BACI|nr:DUF3397 domain-containing protein [Bacillus taeanensis]RBW70220.1 DUF3397 domain-containing protein [Bacillus taeanensis]